MAKARAKVKVSARKRPKLSSNNGGAIFKKLALAVQKEKSKKNG